MLKTYEVEFHADANVLRVKSVVVKVEADSSAAAVRAADAVVGPLAWVLGPYEVREV